MTERIVDPALVEAGIDHLCKVDPIMAGTIAAVGPCKLTLEDNLFYALVDAITSQQISVKAAASILKRICAIYAPDPFPTPERLATTPDEDLRAAGCSRAKVIYLKDLAAHIVAGSVDLARLPQLPDEEIVQALIAVRGIGRWTAEMLLIFSLGRLDVWPVDDLGIVIAAQGIYQLPERPKRKDLLTLGEPWRPYRTIAAWYLWQSRRIVLGMPW